LGAVTLPWENEILAVCPTLLPEAQQQVTLMPDSRPIALGFLRCGLL